MDLAREIDASRIAASRIVAGLIVVLGLTGGVILGRIPRELHRFVLQLLRPAESAVRRLIVVLVRGIAVKASAALSSHSRTPRSGDPGSSHKQRNARNPNTRSTNTVYSRIWAPGSAFGRPGVVVASDRKSCTSFNLFDARPPLRLAPTPSKSTSRPQPRISFFGGGEVRRISLTPEPAPKDDHVDAASIVRRLVAVQAALADLPRQAKRLARALARRSRSPRFKLQGPLRPGRPPGFRRRPSREVDHLLHHCEWLARETLAPNSS